jgi:hypothetical protein
MDVTRGRGERQLRGSGKLGELAPDRECVALGIALLVVIDGGQAARQALLRAAIRYMVMSNERS